jgi:AcrR family transcriptional regulator
MSRPCWNGSGLSRAPYPQLHPGPGWSPAQVASHQRVRISAAMIELVAERGYDAVTIRELVRRAGVSTHSFYERFQSKDECFLYTYELIVRRSINTVGAAQKSCDDWHERQRLAFGAWAQEIAREPQAAWLVLVQAFAAGPVAVERTCHSEAMFATLVEQSFAGAPDAVPIPSLVIQGIVAGVHRVARTHLLSGRERALPDLTDELLEWMLCFRCEATAELVQLDHPPTPSWGAPEEIPGVRPFASPGDGIDGNDSNESDDCGGDRARILDAVARLAAAEGYRQLTVTRIRQAAGVSRKCFDAQFAGVHECFSAALEHFTANALSHATASGQGGHTWAGGLYRAIYALCAYIATDPVFARLGFVEVFEPGLEGMRRRARVLADVAGALRASAPTEQRPSKLAAEASVGAVWGIVYRYIAVGRARELQHIAPILSFLVLAPAIGAARAVREIAAEQGHKSSRSVVVLAGPIENSSPARA